MKFFLLFFLHISIWSVNFADFAPYQKRFTKHELETKIKKYLEKDAKINKFYKITEDAFIIGDLEKQQIDYVLELSLEKESMPRHVAKNKSIQGAKIAIDPGHFGGMFAALEERFVFVPKELSGSQKDISFNEGTLAYLTALELKSLLEEKGAQVLITREGVGKGAVSLDFFTWMKNNPTLWESDKTLSELFRRYYNLEDLFERARIINEFAPDITIIIHYNAHFTDEEKEKNALLTKTNYNLAFVPGAFCANELNKVKNRYEFLRLLVSNSIEESCILSQHLVNQFVYQLKVPLVSKDEKTSYMQNSCIEQMPGVYSRNLALTRLIHSPLCYGETLIQNNEEECLKLSMDDAEINGIKCPSRIKQVAHAYFKGILSYFNTD